MAFVINFCVPKNDESYQKEFDALHNFGLAQNDPNFSIVVNAPLDSQYDFLIVYAHNNSFNIKTHLPKRRCVFMTTEPPNEYKKDADYNQFGLLVTPFKDRYKQHPNIMCSHTYLNWLWYFEKPFSKEVLWAEHNPTRISFVISNKSKRKEHVRRIAFAYHLKKKLGSQIDIYGRGFRPIKQKQEAFENYDYTVVMENSVHSDHWTEKIAHAYYTKCFPFYIGCTNLEQYFPKESFVTLDINNPDEAVRIMRNALDNNLHEKNKEYVLNAREKLMKEYTLDKGLIKIAKYILQQEKVSTHIAYTNENKTILYYQPSFFNNVLKLIWIVKSVIHASFFKIRLRQLLKKENRRINACSRQNSS